MSISNSLRMVTCLSAMALVAWMPSSVQGQSWRTVTMSRQVADESELDVRVAYRAGMLRVRSADSGVLYHMQLRYDEELFEPVAEYENGHLELGIDNIGRRVRVRRNRDPGELELELTTEVPMALKLDFGAGRSDVDLGGLSLTDLDMTIGAADARLDISSPNPVEMRRATLEVGAAEFTARHLGNLNAEEIEMNAGVGKISLDFTGEWARNARVSVEMGVGALELRFPEGLGVKLVKSTFLTSFDSQGLVKRGDAYYSLDWEDAEHRITIDVDASFGGIEVVWVR